MCNVQVFGDFGRRRAGKLQAMNSISPIVVVEGPSCEGAERGTYCFEVFVNGVRGQLQVQEELAFDLVGAWTLSAQTGLDILRLHRAELARALARKLTGGGGPKNGQYTLAWQDLKPGRLSSRLAHLPSATASVKGSRRLESA
jgi:hypothetical protein